MTLSLTFEGTDVDALKAIPKSEGPGERRAGGRGNKRLEQMKELAKEGWLTEEEKEELARKQSPNWRDAPRDAMEPVDELEEVDEQAQRLEREAEAADRETLAEISGQRTADDEKVVFNDEVILKEPLPQATPDSGEQPPAPIHIRNVMLGVKNRSSTEIWDWFKTRTNCTDVPRSMEDEKEFRELEVVVQQSAIDRERVKKGVDERKANDEMLKRARGEVEKLRAEA